MPMTDLPALHSRLAEGSGTCVTIGKYGDGWRKFPDGFPEDGTKVQAIHEADAMSHGPAVASFTPQHGLVMSHFFVSKYMQVHRVPTHWRPFPIPVEHSPAPATEREG